MSASPDVADALRRLESEGLLGPAAAGRLGRIARGELASLDLLLHALLYGGVLAVTAGVGLVVKDRVADLGPVAIALLIGAAALGCLAWCARVAPPFSRGATPSPHVAFDYVLTLGALLVAADLAWIEWRFTPLGPDWAWHLLLVSAIHAALALRFDSRVLFVLALTTFAAWRGVAALSVEQVLFGWTSQPMAVRLNALACGALFIGVGEGLYRMPLKAHFRPVAALAGWALLLGALASGIGGQQEQLYRLALLAAGTFLAWRSWRTDEFAQFALGVLAAYVAFLAIAAPAFRSGTAFALFVAGTAIALLAALLRARRGMERRP